MDQISIFNELMAMADRNLLIFLWAMIELAFKIYQEVLQGHFDIISYYTIIAVAPRLVLQYLL